MSDRLLGIENAIRMRGNTRKRSSHGNAKPWLQQATWSVEEYLRNTLDWLLQ